MAPTSDLQSKRLIALQSFKETVWGTSAAATAKWMGLRSMCEFTPKLAATPYDEDRGVLIPAYRSDVLVRGGDFKLPLWVTYEDFLFVLAGSLNGAASPTGNGTTTPYTWAINAPVGNTQPALQSYTFEYIHNNIAKIYKGCIINKWTIKGEAMKPWEAEVSGFFQNYDISAGTPTGSLADRTAEPAIMPTTTIAIDTLGSTPGTTDYSNFLVSFNLECDTLVKPVYSAGSVTPTHWVWSEKPKIKLSLVLYNTATVQTLMQNTLSQNGAVIVRLVSSGSNVTGVSPNAAKKAQVDFGGVVAKDSAFYTEKEGALTLPIELDAIYDSTNALYLKPTFVNGVAVLP